MKLQISLEEAARAAAEGLTVECFLVIGSGNEPQKGKRRRMITSDNTTYEFNGAPVPSITPGTDVAKAAETLMNNVFKGGTKEATRAELTAQLSKSRKWKKQRAISNIANLRQRNILKVVKL